MAAGVTALDDIDREILRELAVDGRIGWQQLGPRVGLSPNAVAERVRRLERAGVIAGFHAVIDPVALGRNVEAFVFVKMIPGAERAPFEAHLADREAISDATHLTGSHDYVLVVHCFHLGELDAVLTEMKADFPVADTETRMVLRRLSMTGA
jgi:Lrp/AsnC family leucine-responsive transcriptional regulator